MALILIVNTVSDLEEMGESLETLVVRTFSCKATDPESNEERQLHEGKRYHYEVR